jgi:hypothetical protein
MFNYFLNEILLLFFKIEFFQLANKRPYIFLNKEIDSHWSGYPAWFPRIFFRLIF